MLKGEMSSELEINLRLCVDAMLKVSISSGIRQLKRC